MPFYGVPINNGIAVGLGSSIALGVPFDPDELVGNLELEDGFNLLLENGDYILLE